MRNLSVILLVLMLTLVGVSTYSTLGAFEQTITIEPEDFGAESEGWFNCTVYVSLPIDEYYNITVYSGSASLNWTMCFLNSTVIPEISDYTVYTVFYFGNGTVGLLGEAFPPTTAVMETGSATENFTLEWFSDDNELYCDDSFYIDDVQNLDDIKGIIVYADTLPTENIVLIIGFSTMGSYFESTILTLMLSLISIVILLKVVDKFFKR